MPCRYDGPETETVSVSKLDKVTRVACELLTQLETMLIVHENVDRFATIHYMRETRMMSEETVAWCEQHKIDDAKRKEDLKASALAKLTDEEKEVLGLDVE